MDQPTAQQEALAAGYIKPVPAPPTQAQPPAPPRPPATPHVAQPGLPINLTTEESYNIISDWAAESAEQTAGFPPDQLYRQEKEYSQLVQNLQPSKEAEEEHSFWCE